MSVTSLGFVGGGRITRILLGGLARAGSLPEKVVVSDPDDDLLAKLGKEFPTLETACGNTVSAMQEVVILAVHPPVVPAALSELKDSLAKNAKLVSLAPKVTLARLSDLLDGFDRLARVIPNAASLVGAGYNPVAFGPGLTDEDKTDLLDLLSALGEAPEVPEELLEPYALITAMGPTYLWYQFYELQSLAESFGLEADAAREAVVRMVNGSLATMTDSGLSAEEVLDLIPIKPLADLEPGVREAYRTKLAGLLEKIRP